MKISVVTPSVRPELIPIVKKCLARQTFREFEWRVGTPAKYLGEMEKAVGSTVFDTLIVEEPPKREGDYYGLNKCWNELFRNARGELIVSIQDGIWFEPDLLEKFWIHYQNDPKSCVSAIGHQYDKMKNGKPENRVWSDPRARLDQGSFYSVGPREMEFCVASIPRLGIFEVGGIDEIYDRFAALSEKELCARLERRDYKFFLDQSCEYRAIHHPRLNEEWDIRYNAGCEVYIRHLQEIAEEKRVRLEYLPHRGGEI